MQYATMKGFRVEKRTTERQGHRKAVQPRSSPQAGQAILSMDGSSPSCMSLGLEVAGSRVVWFGVCLQCRAVL
jgi:hypothetical protein